MTKKTRFDSVAGALESFRSAKLKLDPPKHTSLQDGADDFYNAIIDSRDASMWNSVDLARAVTLANYQKMIKENSELLDEEGSVVINDRGTPIMNPRFNVVNMLARLEISLSKALQTDAASTQGEGREVKKRNTNAKKVKAVIAESENDPLLAGFH